MSGFRADRFPDSSELGFELAHVRADDCPQTHDKIGKLAGGDFVCRGSQAISKNLADVQHRHRVTGEGKETLAACYRVCHCPNVQVSAISRVDQPEVQARTVARGADI